VCRSQWRAAALFARTLRRRQVTSAPSSLTFAQLDAALYATEHRCGVRVSVPGLSDCISGKLRLPPALPEFIYGFDQGRIS
jgi:hypothetical protein